MDEKKKITHIAHHPVEIICCCGAIVSYNKFNEHVKDVTFKMHTEEFKKRLDTIFGTH